MKKFLFLVLLFFVFPVFSFADTSKISILPVDPLTILPDTLSGQMTVQSQDDSGPIKTTEKINLTFKSSSQTGQFFSATGKTVPKSISSGDYNSNFSYQDSTEGTFTITVNALGVTTGKEWIASQQITISSDPSLQNSTADSSGEVLGDSTGSSSSSASSSGGSSTNNVSSPSAQLEVLAGSDRTTSPGSPIWFQATVKKNTTGATPELDWSFGDGNVGIGSLVSHTYKYPGDYAVVLNPRAGDIFSVSRLKVKVVESDISIKDQGEYLEISNNSNTEINLFNWKIENNGKGFIFQPNTIILPKSSIKLEKSLLNMKGLGNSLGTALKNSFGKEVFSVAPVVEVDLAEAGKSLDVIKNEVSSIQEKAKNLGLIPQVKITSAQSANISNAISALENKNNESTTTGITDNIIYEAPKQEGFISKLTNFIKRVFSR